MKKSFAAVIGFISICFIILIKFTGVFSFKHLDGAYVLKAFYEQDDNINDVIFVGSSNIFENVNTGVLWDEYGIASFDLAGSGQRMWNGYYYMKEALKTQFPKLIVLDMLAARPGGDYMDSGGIIKNTYGMRFSFDKLEAVKVSSPEEERNNYLWGIPTYHTRYKELNSEDFLSDISHTGVYNLESWKGFSINPATTVFDTPEGFQTDEKAAITEKTEKYLRKICQLCQERNIQLLLIKTPYVTNVEDTMRYNRAAEIAGEYGVPFVNFNYYYDEMGFDFGVDIADTSHLNYKGNVKFTKFLADYIIGHYDIPDRRGENGYESYNMMSKDCEMRVYNIEVSETVNLATYLNKIQNENYIIIYSVCGDYKNASNYDMVKDKLRLYGIELDTVEASSVWVKSNAQPADTMDFASGNEQEYLWYTELAPYKNLKITGRTDAAPSVLYNRAEQTKVSSGLNIIVYDTVTEAIVEAVGFPMENDSISYTKE